MKKYDPTWLIKSVERVQDNYPWLLDALKECTEATEENHYTYFLKKPTQPNVSNSEWQFQESITLENTPEGEIVLDIIKNNRIAGIEFLSKLMDS